MKKLDIFVLLICIKSFFIVICNCSLVSIGYRVEGDKLLIADKLRSKTKSYFPTNHTIDFQYSIDRSVSFVLLESENNVLVVFDLKYDGILYGHAVAINATMFELSVSIYGFDSKEIPENFHSVLNYGTSYTGTLDDEYSNYDEYFLDIDDPNDTIMEIGGRQKDDILLYDDFKTSSQSVKPTNHSVTFYFIDNVYLTFAKFIASQTKAATVTYNHVTDKSLKAVIEDTNVTYLHVQCLLYGYKSDNKPPNYMSLIANIVNDDENSHGKSSLCLEPENLRERNKENKSTRNHLNFVITLIGVFIVIICYC